MKQMRLGFLEQGLIKPTLTLEPKVEEELVAEMAEAIMEVFKRGGIRADDRNSEKQ